MTKTIALALTLFAAGSQLFARTLITQAEALESAFPSGVSVTRQTIFLTEQQAARARQASGVPFQGQLVIRYEARKGSQLVGYAYFDTHRVRTLPETLMIVVGADSQITRVEILSFTEPADYLPKRRWLDQLHRHRLNEELSLKRAIRPISGATLSGRAVVEASRKTLAIHEVVGTSQGNKALPAK